MTRFTSTCFSFIPNQGGDVSSFPENNNPGEGFQTSSSEERAGEGHQEDGKKTVNTLCGKVGVESGVFWRIAAVWN